MRLALCSFASIQNSTNALNMTIFWGKNGKAHEDDQRFLLQWYHFENGFHGVKAQLCLIYSTSRTEIRCIDLTSTVFIPSASFIGHSAITNMVALPQTVRLQQHKRCKNKK